jgi:hypothetical protein
MEEDNNQTLQYNENISVTYLNSFIPTAKHLNIICFNITSLQNKLHELEAILSKCKYTIHIVFILETWLTADIARNYNIEKYKAIFNCRETERRGGGVCIYVHESIQYDIIENDIIDGVFISTISIPKYKVNLAGVYKPPDITDTVFIGIIDERLERSRNYIYFGDFNFDLLSCNEIKVRRYCETICQNGFRLLNRVERRDYTNLYKQTGKKTIIDHMFTDLFRNSFNVCNVRTSISSHSCLVLNVEMDRKIQCIEKEMRKIDFSEVARRLEEFLHIFPDVCFDGFHAKLCSLINENEKIVVLKTNGKFRKEWATGEYVTMIDQRDFWKKRFDNFPNNLLAERNFKKFKNRAENLRKRLIKNSNGRKFLDCKGNIKRTWAVSNEILFGKRTGPSCVRKLVASDSRVLHDEFEIANEFNEYFTSVAHDLARRLVDGNPGGNRRFTMSYNSDLSISFHLTNELEVQRAINDLNIGSAAGVDKVPVKFLRNISSFLTPHLVRMINDCIMTAVFPKSLKVAKVCPVYKQGTHMSAANYRPISVLSNLAKVYERIICNRLLSFYTFTKFFNEQQYGFVPQSNTTAAVTNFVHKVQTAVDKRGFCAGLFIDVSKAFDCVQHDILLGKVKRSGVRGSPHDLIQNYLEGREQFVMIGNSYGNRRVIDVGVPQGSILGPKMFLIYINDIFELDLKGEIQLYADDAAIFYEADSVEELQQDMQNDLLKLSEWFFNNGLTFNVGKTKFIVFHHHRKVVPRFDLFVGLNKVDEVTDITYLGLRLQKSCKWHLQVDHVKSRVVPFVGIFRRIFPVIPMEIRKMLYYAYIHSQFIYLNPIWNRTENYKMKELQICQNKVVRNMFLETYRSDVNIHTVDLYRKFEIPTLKIICCVRSVNLIYCLKNKLLQGSIEFTNVGQIHDHATRSRSNLVNRGARTNFALEGVISSGISLFNALPETMRNQNFSQFMKDVTAFYFSAFLD